MSLCGRVAPVNPILPRGKYVIFRRLCRCDHKVVPHVHIRLALLVDVGTQNVCVQITPMDAPRDGFCYTTELEKSEDFHSRCKIISFLRQDEDEAGLLPAYYLLRGQASTWTLLPSNCLQRNCFQRGSGGAQKLHQQELTFHLRVERVLSLMCRVTLGE